ncbi:hypothetical protein [Spirulina sp. 06S082]|uniref:hypothetical protein n=1 Tax=Spirulina sp. 06S082 TaxID=3110248 RepID=UPI002B214333|nr:hypothetical protein [Spirulina sp. 06S082]MEA5469754.1 hypothetical protein [Spirulina sp. 06S082]
MRNYKTLLIGLFIWGFTAVGAQAACPNGNPQELNYIRRENNRCEGIVERSSISGSLRLISLTTRGVNSFGNNLTIRIPRLANTSRPNVTLRAIEQDYQLNELRLVPRSQTYNFHWSTYVLKKAGILPTNLRAIANTGSQIVYIPVIIGSPADRYEFVFHSSSPVRFKTLQIKHNGTIVHTDSTPIFEKGEISFPWDGRNQNTGRYQLYYEAEIERIGRAPRLVRRTLTFAHNPNWLR